MTSSTSKRRFWLLYCAAWIPLFAGNLAMVLGEMETSIPDAMRRALAFVMPAAILGIAVLAAVRRMPSVGERPIAFWLAQLVLSMIYGVAYAGGVFLWRWLEAVFQGDELQYGTGWFFWFVLSGFMIYGALAGVGYGLGVAERLRQEEARSARAEALRSEAELAALRAQLNPHFLFNTLHSLLALVRHDPEQAQQALEQFGDLLRYTLRIQQDTVDEVPLAEEWAFVENYLELERLRLGDRLRLETALDPAALRRLVPVFSLQPLVENAVAHAVAPRAGGGTVKVSAEIVDGGGLLLEVSDDGPGADPDALAGGARSNGNSHGNGVGLRIVRQRLEALSHGRARFDVETGNGKGFTVRLSFPRESEAVETAP